MAKGAAPGQVSTSVNRGGAGSGAPARSGPAGTNAAMRRRPTGRASAAGAGAPPGNNMGNAGMLRFYTDDAPGLRITPVMVMVMSLCFIGFVTVLHVVGKLYGA
mmetsp:Transcript_1924/g.2147  ORF Transcript_1924/g.2147 Transcript_1924/m.2147 type:complete len:104 (+) Transcript_1924:108-419(+)|eukprot:CAMPEP_0197847588 /NCGR_PEP_ID=MMETSP1438-20131217/6513_1 /TAXON_ID=1461541 /ORGANISM="Pterosperma sp., Strain CCMP1384" /LENGTH=103 /DNA_ID=CAMNT_0043459553 /DNA_START=94 /DNA_END=405 /DNA_ORIENTATION=+